MADLAQLLVRIDATTEQLRRELARADASVTATQRNIDGKLGLIDARFSKASTAVTAFAGGIVRGIVPALGALTAIQAGRSIADFTVGLVAAGDEIAETARSLDLSTDALQEYRHALGLSGVTAEEFERALKFMNNAIGTFARTGKGEAAAALNELGLATEFASGRIKGADAQFLAIIDRLGQVGDAQRRASLEADLFGQKVGPKFATAIDKGVAALQRERQAVHDLGLVLNEESIERSDRLADAWVRLGAAAQGVGVQIGTVFLPALEGLTDILGDLAGSRPEEPLLDLQEQIEGLTDAQSALIDQMNQAPSGSPEFERYKTQVNELNAAILVLQKRLDALRSGQSGATADLGVTLPTPEELEDTKRGAEIDANIQKMERQVALLREQKLTSEQISAVMQQEFQTGEGGVQVFRALSEANRERLSVAVANLDAAKKEADFLEQRQKAQAQGGVDIQKMERQADLLREHKLTSEQIAAVMAQEFQAGRDGVDIFQAMSQANRERLVGALANLETARKEAAFLEQMRQAQGQNVAATLGFDSAELRDAAEAALALNLNIQNISTPAEFQAWLDGLPAQTQAAIAGMQGIQATASNIKIGQQLSAQLAELELANSVVNQQTEEYRVQAQILQLELQTHRQITDAQRGKVQAIQEQITLQRQNQALLELERETTAAQRRASAAGDPRAQLMSRLTGGLAPQEQRVQGRLDEAALQGIDPATIEASARQMEELNTQMAIAETVSGELAQGATELGAALAFEGVDEAGARLTEMLQSLVQGLTEAIIQALIFRAIMAGISGFGAPTTATPAPGQTGPGGMLGHAQKGGHFDKGRRISVAEDRKTELWVPDALTPPHLTPRDVPAIATATELPEIAVRRLSSSRPGRVLLGIVSGGGEPLAAPTEIGEGGDPRNVAAPAGVALLGAEGRPEIILATTPGTVLPNPDVVALQSSPAGRSFLRQIEQRQLGGPVQAGKPYQVGEVGRELVIDGVNAKVVGEAGRQVVVPEADGVVLPHDRTEKILERIERPTDGQVPEGRRLTPAATAVIPAARQLGGPIQAGKPYQVGEAGRELLVEGGKARLIGVSGREIIVPKANSIVFPHADTERMMQVLPGLRSAGDVSGGVPWSASQLAQEINVPQPAKDAAIPGTDKLVQTVPGLSADGETSETPPSAQAARGINVTEPQTPAFPQDDRERILQALPGLQAGGWATAMPPVGRPPAAPAASGAPNVSFQIIDQRGKDAPPIEHTTQTMPDGRVMAVAIVRAARAEMARTGEDQEYMRRQFGVGPRPR